MCIEIERHSQRLYDRCAERVGQSKQYEMWISTAFTNLIKEVITLSHTVGRIKSHSLIDGLVDKEDAPCAIF